ncbi:MAG: hybrid sensor histidine kinase/response regulator [Comamonadaceae bacterium SCN 68-20]|nr:MAG: hybrid sensor histidine kinase/response regulator [Comamonadaceae bacterium SCN 68-20]OJX10460.1 MAG: hybrid sensor histidine kinase/response regulator [Burkholderiales bacterium 68-20]
MRWERDAVLAEQVLLLRRNFPVTLWASLITSVGTVWVMSLGMPMAPMLWWLASHVAVVTLVYLTLRPLPRPGHGPRSDARRLLACMTGMGLTWGSLGGVALWQGQGSDAVVYAIGILSTVSAGALGLGAPLLRGYMIYLTCTISSVLVALAVVGGPIALPGCVMVAVYYLLTALHARNLARAARDSIELRFDNERLVTQLRAQTDRAVQALAAAEQANQDKSRFLAAASHDLRQPLHAMGLFLDTLARSPLTAQQASVLGHARTASGAASEMLTTLLDYSRLEAGVVQAHDAPFAVQPLLGALEQEFGPQADAAALVYRTRETTAAALADKALVDLVMRNFISNALRYTRTGGLLIACRARGGRLALEVWDTGCGIAPAHQQDVFKEFHQLGNPERDRRKGLGLGLAIVQRLAQAMHTQVEVRSRLGRGSVFRLWLTPWRGALVDEAVASTHDGASLAGRRVLVVDDDEPVRLGMQSLLASWGCHCLCAESAADALARLHQMPQPDVVVTDFRLRHEETGRQVLDTLRAHLQRSVPAIIMTGDTSPQRLRDAQSTGALLLHKPVSAAQLREALLELVQ